MESKGASATVNPTMPDRSLVAITRAKISEAKPKDRATLLKEAAKLEKLLIRKQFVPEKVLIQGELGYMRQKLLSDRRKINVTYPVNPPFAFVRVFFDSNEGELQ